MDHARTEDLHPASLFADAAALAAADAALHVHLRRRLREREEARPEARRPSAEEPIRESREGRLQVHEADPLVDAQPFDLLEGGGVRRIEEVAPIGTARNEHANGWCITLERPHL